MDYYSVLGVSESATSREIKDAYRRLVKMYHPDINPSPVADDKMRTINEAYEILANSQTRNLYDLQRRGVPVEKQEETPYERYKREYRQKKMAQERQRMETLLRWKIRFYGYQRKACVFFFAIGVLFTIDYYLYRPAVLQEIKRIDGEEQRETNIETRDLKVSTSGGLLSEYNLSKSQQIQVYYSSVFGIPVQVRLPDSTNAYAIRNTLHSFKNILSIIILVFSSIVIGNKEYSDFRLSSGLVPILLVLFLVLFVLAKH